MSETNMTRNEMEAEIRACKSLLNDSDYLMIKLFEQLIQCETASDMAALFNSFSEERGELVANRTKWRNTINEMEGALDALEDDTEVDEE